jgi:hypothetical protein
MASASANEAHRPHHQYGCLSPASKSRQAVGVLSDRTMGQGPEGGTYPVLVPLPGDHGTSQGAGGVDRAAVDGDENHVSQENLPDRTGAVSVVVLRTGSLSVAQGA